MEGLRKNELSRMVLDIIVYLSDKGEKIYDVDTQGMLEDFWKKVGEAEQIGVNCEIYRTQISNAIVSCRRSLLKLLK